MRLTQTGEKERRRGAESNSARSDPGTSQAGLYCTPPLDWLELATTGHRETEAQPTSMGSRDSKQRAPRGAFSGSRVEWASIDGRWAEGRLWRLDLRKGPRPRGDRSQGLGYVPMRSTFLALTPYIEHLTTHKTWKTGEHQPPALPKPIRTHQSRTISMQLSSPTTVEFAQFLHLGGPDFCCSSGNTPFFGNPDRPSSWRHLRSAMCPLARNGIDREPISTGGRVWPYAHRDVLNLQKRLASTKSPFGRARASDWSSSFGSCISMAGRSRLDRVASGGEQPGIEPAAVLLPQSRPEQVRRAANIRPKSS